MCEMQFPMGQQQHRRRRRRRRRCRRRSLQAQLLSGKSARLAKQAIEKEGDGGKLY
jgi:hypothetical protein